MITANCRDRFTASDFDFIIRTLAAARQQTASLSELLTEAETRDMILDHEALFHAVLEADSPLAISPQCYFYILLRHVLKQQGIVGREVCDYLASLLETFSHIERMRAPSGAGEGVQQYVSDLLLAQQKASNSQQFLLRAHIGNYALFITGVFQDRVEERSKRGAPDMEFYEHVGASNFLAASVHSVAREHLLTPIFEELGERFHEIRCALNQTAETHMHLDEAPFPSIITP